MGRAPCCDKANVKKGPWSPEEDSQLKHYIETYGTGGNWISLPQKAGLRRCGKSCRLRWLNYLRPNIKHGEFSAEEDRIICTLFATIGSRWSIIAAQLPGRTDNDIKNYWNTKLKKKLMGMVSSSTTSKSPQAIKKTESLSPLLLCHQNAAFDHQPLSNYNSLNPIIGHHYEEEQPLSLSSSSTNSIIPFNCCNPAAIISSSGCLVTNPFDHQWQCYETLKTNPLQMGLFEFGSGSFNSIISNNNNNNGHGNFGENEMDYDGMLLSKNMEDEEDEEAEEQIEKKKKREMEEKSEYCYYC